MCAGSKSVHVCWCNKSVHVCWVMFQAFPCSASSFDTISSSQVRDDSQTWEQNSVQMKVRLGPGKSQTLEEELDQDESQTGTRKVKL